MNRLMCFLTGGHKYSDANIRTETAPDDFKTVILTNHCVKCGALWVTYMDVKKQIEKDIARMKGVTTMPDKLTDNLKISIAETMCFKEFDILLGDTIIGSAEIKYPTMTLNNFSIYPQYQGKGYGTEAIRLFVENFGITNLWVDPDNEAAKHIYEKNGFVADSKPLFIAMRRKDDLNVDR